MKLFSAGISIFRLTQNRKSSWQHTELKMPLNGIFGMHTTSLIHIKLLANRPSVTIYFRNGRKALGQSITPRSRDCSKFFAYARSQNEHAFINSQNGPSYYISWIFHLVTKFQLSSSFHFSSHWLHWENGRREKERQRESALYAYDSQIMCQNGILWFFSSSQSIKDIFDFKHEEKRHEW